MTRNQWLAAIALVLAGSAAVAGSSRPRASAVDLRTLAAAIEREEDHVTAVELATWIRERKEGLRVLDLSTAEEYEAYHVPSARRVAMTSLVTMPLDQTETIVLYSQGGAHAAQAWVMLRARGARNVYFLSGGLQAWMTEVMSPVLPDGGDAAVRAEVQRIGELSRYFGGIPRTGKAGEVVAPAESIEEVRRRGC